MIAVRGAGSEIAYELKKLLHRREFVAVARGEPMPLVGRYLFCTGLLRDRPKAEQTADEIREGYDVNYRFIVAECERVLALDENARICVIGSESAYRGSYDEAYAEAKLLLHKWVERRELGSNQQLVAISPGVIQDAGQCVRRTDRWRTEQRRKLIPRQRFLKAYEVARLVHFALYMDEGYLTNVVIRFNGGEHTRRVYAGAIRAA